MRPEAEATNANAIAERGDDPTACCCKLSNSTRPTCHSGVLLASPPTRAAALVLLFFCVSPYVYVLPAARTRRPKKIASPGELLAGFAVKAAMMGASVGSVRRPATGRALVDSCQASDLTGLQQPDQAWSTAPYQNV